MSCDVGEVTESLENELRGAPLWSRGNIFISQAAGPGSIPGRVTFLVEFFSGFSLNLKTNVRKFGSHSSPVIIWSS